MVPKKSIDLITYISTLRTVTNIFIQLLKLADEKKKNILFQNWDNVYKLADEQEELNQFFDESLLEFDKNEVLVEKSNMTKTQDQEITKLKNDLCLKVAEYKEKELTNAKLLKDALFVAQQKVEKYFKSYTKKVTYSKNRKLDSDLWGDIPVILNKII